MTISEFRKKNKNKNKTIIITNDDGPNAEGLNLLIEQAMFYNKNPIVVVPADNKSGVGTLSNHNVPLKLEMEWRDFPAKTIKIYKVHGSPIDCVNFAIFKALQSGSVINDMVIFSGVNHGHNMGVHMLYSGTCAAAREGCTKGIAAAAISIDDFSPFTEPAENKIGSCLHHFFNQKMNGVWLNYTIPAVTAISHTHLFNVVEESTAHINYYEETITTVANDSFFIRSGILTEFSEIKKDSDFFAVKNKKVISVSKHLPYL